MQLGGIGKDHDAHSHQVTGCMHEHTHYQKLGSSGAASSVTTNVTALQKVAEQQEVQFSLVSWMEKARENGRKFLRGIWGTNEVQSASDAGDRDGKGSLMAQPADNAAAGGTPRAGEAAMEQQSRLNVYFREVEQKPNLQMTPARRLRVKLKESTAKLFNHLPGNFFGARTKHSFQAKQQRTKEDLRRRSKYRTDELEIDCILTDESYLMDSYDRKGEYSQLTTRK